jgi:molecular chaperone Hsp33
MIQHMPKASPFAKGDGGSGEGGLLTASSAGWRRGRILGTANLLLDTVEELELIGPGLSPTACCIGCSTRNRRASFRCSR